MRNWKLLSVFKNRMHSMHRRFNSIKQFLRNQPLNWKYWKTSQRRLTHKLSFSNLHIFILSLLRSLNVDERQFHRSCSNPSPRAILKPNHQTSPSFKIWILEFWLFWASNQRWRDEWGSGIVWDWKLGSFVVCDLKSLLYGSCVFGRSCSDGGFDDSAQIFLLLSDLQAMRIGIKFPVL